MVLAIDSSSPARVNKPGTAAPDVTTAAFNPPAGSLLIVTCHGDGNGSLFTITDNSATLGALVVGWNEIGRRNNADSGGASGIAQAFYAILRDARTGMTVIATYGQSNDTSLKVYVITGFDATDPIGGYVEGSSTSADTTTSNLVSEQASTLGFVAFNDFNARIFTSSSDTTFDTGTISGEITFGTGYKTLGAAGSSNTFEVLMSAAPAMNYVAFEVRAAVTPTYQAARATAIGASVSRDAATLPQSTASTLFTVTGGRVLLLSLVGEVTTAIQNQANNTKLIGTPASGTAVDLCAALDVANKGVGTLLGITGQFGDAMIAAGGATVLQAMPVVLPVGTIKLSCAASNTGSVKWTMTYVPLDDGALVY